LEALAFSIMAMTPIQQLMLSIAVSQSMTSCTATRRSHATHEARVVWRRELDARARILIIIMVFLILLILWFEICVELMATSELAPQYTVRQMIAVEMVLVARSILACKHVHHAIVRMIEMIQWRKDLAYGSS